MCDVSQQWDLETNVNEKTMKQMDSFRYRALCLSWLFVERSKVVMMMMRFDEGRGNEMKVSFARPKRMIKLHKTIENELNESFVITFFHPFEALLFLPT